MTHTASAVRVLVVDDSPPFREAVRAMIDAMDGFEWVGDANCGETGVEQAVRHRPDLVLIDVRMPGIGGVEAARMITARALPPVVALVSGEEFPDVNETATAILPKCQLNPASLKRLWEQHRGQQIDGANGRPLPAEPSG